MHPRRLPVLILSLALVWVAGCPAAAQVSSESLLAKMEAADPSMQTYRATVEFSIGMRTMPFIKKTIHGTTFFKRPDKMEIQFTDLPPYAAHFKNVYIGLGSPRDWEKKFVVTAIEDAEPPGAHLLLVPRASERRLRDIAVYFDPQSSLPSRIVWNYHDGLIDMKQTIVAIEGHYVVSAQNADMRLPWVRASIKTRIKDYAFNMPLDDVLFRR